MRVALLVQALLLCLLGACGQEQERRETGSAGNNGQTPRGAPPAGELPAAPRPIDQSDQGVVTATGAVQGAPTDGGPRGPGEVVLRLGPAARVTGSVTLEGQNYKVAGIVDGPRLRCWLTGPGQEPDQHWRGILLGTRKGDQLAGALTVSSSGGRQVEHREWNATLKAPGAGH